MDELNGRTAVVTGAASGIGLALSGKFADLDMHVVMADVEEGALRAAATDVGGLAVVTDVADPASVDALAAAAYDAHGAVHVLCNNAGVFVGGLLWERSDADWDWVMGVNVRGIINGIRSLVPRMLARGQEGHIVNTASMAGLTTTAFSGPYTTSKFAAVALSESLSHDLRTQDAPIGVSVLCPSLIATQIGSSDRNRPDGRTLGEDHAFVEQALRDSTSGHGLPPSDVAEMVVDAIRTGRFLIPTKPSYERQLEERHRYLVAGEPPTGAEYD